LTKIWTSGRGGKRPGSGRPKSANPKTYPLLLKLPDGTFSKALTAAQADAVKAYVEEVTKDDVRP
jgi:hypothetical protein